MLEKLQQGEKDFLDELLCSITNEVIPKKAY